MKRTINTWQSVHAELQRRISERTWAPGALLPAETELAEEFGCARATINRAMRVLAEAGQIERRRKAGTRVVRNPVRKATMDIPIIRQEVERRGMRWSHRVLEQKSVKPPERVRNRLLLPATGRALHLRSLHYANGEPFVYEDRWINVSAVPKIRQADLTAISANEWLVQQVPFTDGEIELSASSATPREAQLLGIARGSPLLIVDRVTSNQEKVITTVRLAYPPGYRISIRL